MGNRGSGRQELGEAPVTYNEHTGIRKEKSQKSNIMGFLEDLGYEEIFNSQEAKEIKSMFSKNPSNMSKNESMLDAIHKFDADYEDEIKENLEEAQSQNGSNAEETKEEQVSEDHELGLKTKNFTVFENYDCYTLKGHLGPVTDGAFISQLDQAITVSSDSTIKLWDLNHLSNDSQNPDNNSNTYIRSGSEFGNFTNDEKIIFPYLSINGNSAFTKVVVDNRQAEEPQNTLFYTSGDNGVISTWRTTNPEEVKEFENDADFVSNLCLYIYEAHSGEPILALNHHSVDPLLLSASKSGISLWNLPTQEEISQLHAEGGDISSQLLAQNFLLSQDSYLAPTCLDW